MQGCSGQWGKKGPGLCRPRKSIKAYKLGLHGSTVQGSEEKDCLCGGDRWW